MKLPQNNKSTAVCLLSVFVNLAIFYSYALASANYSPNDGWLISAPEEQGMHSKMLLAMMEEIKKKGYKMESQPRRHNIRFGRTAAATERHGKNWTAFSQQREMGK